MLLAHCSIYLYTLSSQSTAFAAENDFAVPVSVSHMADHKDAFVMSHKSCILTHQAVCFASQHSRSPLLMSMPLRGRYKLSAIDTPHICWAVLSVTSQLVHAVQLLPLLLNRGPVLVVAHLGLWEEMISLVASIPRGNIVVDCRWSLTGNDLNKITKGQRLMRVSQLLIVHLQPHFQ